MSSEITIIMTLFNTPFSKLSNLKQYKKFKLILFDQNTNGENKKKLKKELKFKFQYFYSSKNIGLSKASNFLLSKVKSKYCLFTQPDIEISQASIKLLHDTIKNKNDFIFVAPKHVRTKSFKKEPEIPKYKIVKKLKAAIMLCNVKKLNKIGFFDEDFFLYWEDVALIKKINKLKYKMALVKNASAIHKDSQSSEKNLKTDFIRVSNYTYGELLFDYKEKRIRFIKILRKLTQNIIFFFFHIVFFQLKKAFNNFARLIGTIKFVKYYIYKSFLT